MTFSPDLLVKCWFLAGPTAAGKTAASLQLARRINAEIVSLDSMTIYRGMDVGTAKASLEERAEIPHHLIDILDPHQEFSLAEYLLAADGVCRDILSRGRTPLFVGGTGLYLRGLLRGVFEGPAADWSIRQELEQLALQNGSGFLHDRLQSVDPVTASRLHPNDQRRVIRALEVHQLTGQPLSQLQRNTPRPLNERPALVCWIEPPRDWLYQRINDRVVQMFDDGLAGEVRQLMSRQPSLSHTARQALGYKEVIDWLEAHANSEASLGDTSAAALCRDPHDVIDLIQTRTRQFAKRQHTWFRNLEECCSVSIDGTESAEEVAERIIHQANSIARKSTAIDSQ